MKVLLVDDEPYILDEMRYYLSQIEGVKIVAETGDADEVIPLIDKYKPDLVFLDIHLQMDNGMVLGRRISDMENAPFIVFATAFADYAVQGFDMGAIDYILKPFTKDRITKCIRRVELAIRGSSQIDDAVRPQKLVITKGEHMMLIDPDGVAYVEYSDIGLFVYSKGETYLTVGFTLKRFVDLYKNFIRINKNVAVSINYIDVITKWFNYTYRITVKGYPAVELQVNRSYTKEFKTVLGL